MGSRANAISPPVASQAPKRKGRGREACTSVEPLGPEALLSHLQERGGLASEGSVVHCESFPARPATHAALEGPLSLRPEVAAALAGVGVSRLYSHQAEAIAAALMGKNVLVATATASGAPGEALFARTVPNSG